MSAVALTADTFLPPARPSALHSLMQMWEEEPATENEESETELMVMLSGMVGSHATAIDD